MGPTVASVVVGLAIGVVAVLGISAISEQPSSGAVDAGNALLGDPEYGSR